MEDEKLAAATAILAQEALRIAYDQFQISLDFSAASLQQVDSILAQWHKRLPHNRLIRRLWLTFAADLDHTAVIWGSYVGEVLRRQWGGVWVSISQRATQPVFAMRLYLVGVGTVALLPASRIYRMLIGEEMETLWRFYQRVRWLVELV
ncbi:MAG: hypothetical protein R3C14_22940 [Caldilineaceae bacterium]